MLINTLLPGVDIIGNVDTYEYTAIHSIGEFPWKWFLPIIEISKSYGITHKRGLQIASLSVNLTGHRIGRNGGIGCLRNPLMDQSIVELV